MSPTSTLLSLAALTISNVYAVENGLARTPQMGWNNWNTFACDVTEDLLLSTADKLTTTGLRDAGYHYLVLDDCWQGGRDPSTNRLYPNTTKFPNGLAEVADRIHDHGFKFGMYSTAGTWTCGRYPASLGYEEIDAQTFAEWGVDYLKYDNCFNEGLSGTPAITADRYKSMARALNATGRPILYSMCNWGEDYPWKWAQTVANSWRMSGDITDSFDRPDPRCPCGPDSGTDCALPGFHCSAMNILGKVASYVDKGIPGAWNDLDMLEVGNGGMSDTEYVTHFSMWAAVKSPLILGNDVRGMSPRTLSILTNPAVLAISQDAAGSSAVRRWRYFYPSTAEESTRTLDAAGQTLRDQDTQGVPVRDEVQMWSGSLSHGDYVLIFLNLGSTNRTISTTLSEIFVDAGGSQSTQAQSSWDMHDLWANRMPDSVAEQILAGANATVNASGNSTTNLVAPPSVFGTNVTAGYYWNATARSFGDGVAANETILLGPRTGSVDAMGTVEAEVESHGVKMWRLRRREGGLRRRDEL